MSSLGLTEDGGIMCPKEVLAGADSVGAATPEEDLRFFRLLSVKENHGRLRCETTLERKRSEPNQTPRFSFGMDQSFSSLRTFSTHL